MTKQELINAINATIVANGQKGITAESLNNILTEIVNATPEGGSGGASPIYLVKASNVVISDDGTSVTMSSTEEDMAHNATLYAECVALLEQGKAVDIRIDISALFNAVMGISVFIYSIPANIAYYAEENDLGFPVCIELASNMQTIQVFQDGSVEYTMSFE